MRTSGERPFGVASLSLDGINIVGIYCEPIHPTNGNNAGDIRNSGIFISYIISYLA